MSSSIHVKPHISKVRRFIEQERKMRETVFAGGGFEKRKKREAKLAECDEALAALVQIETTFIPRVEQGDMFA